MIPVSVSEIRSWHVQHRDEGDWRWCAIDRLLGELDRLAVTCRVPGDITIRCSTSPFCICSHEQRHHDLIRGCSWMDCDCERFANARDHVDREENHG